MSKQVQIRRGTAASHINFTGAAGEITVDTTNNRVIVHDGTTIGGHTGVKRTDVFTNGYPLLRGPNGNIYFEGSNLTSNVSYVGSINTPKVAVSETGIILGHGETADKMHVQAHRIAADDNSAFTAIYDGQNINSIDSNPTTALLLASGNNTILGRSRLVSTTTNGFPYIPQITGVPTANPTRVDGFCPIVINTGNMRLYVHNQTGKWWFTSLTSV